MWSSTSGWQAEIHKYWMKFKCICYKSISFTVWIYTMTIGLLLLKCSASVGEKYRSLAWIHCFDCENDVSKHNAFCNPSSQILQIHAGSFWLHATKRKNYSFNNNQPADQETYTAFSTSYSTKKSETWSLSRIMCAYIRIRYAYKHMRWWFPEGNTSMNLPWSFVYTWLTPTITVV